MVRFRCDLDPQQPEAQNRTHVDDAIRDAVGFFDATHRTGRLAVAAHLPGGHAVPVAFVHAARPGATPRVVRHAIGTRLRSPF